MFGTLGRRVAEGLVGLFAILGFAFVPLGSRTGLEHAITLFGSPSAREAAAGLIGAFDRARVSLLRAFASPSPGPPTPASPPRGVHPLVPTLPKALARERPPAR